MKVIDFFRTATEEQLANFLNNAINDREVFNPLLCESCKKENGCCLNEGTDEYRCPDLSEEEEVKKWLNIEIESFDEFL